MQAPEPRTASATLAERYRVLLEIGHTLAGTLDSEDLYRALHRETEQVLEASSFCVSRYDESSDTATVVFYADEGGERKASVSYRGSESEAIRTGKGVIHGEGPTVPPLPPGDDEEHREAATRSSISAPIRYKGRTVGVLSVHSDRADAYTEEDIELLGGIADIAAVAMENARFVAELERQRREAEQIEEIGRALTSSLDTDEVLTKVAEAARSVMEIDGSTVWLLEGTVGRVHASVGEVALPRGAAWDVSGGIYEKLVEERTSVLVPDLSAEGAVPSGLRDRLTGGSGLAVPLVVANEVAGALSAGSRTPRAFSPGDVRVLERIASQASVALENARLHSSLHALSLTEPLTGLPNRRHLQMHLQREVAAARRGRDLVLVMFDLDNFKVYNDAAGHLAGDDALRAFAQALSDENRAMNLVARYGGDEFVSVLSDSTLDGAREFIRRVRARIADDPILGPNDITVSTGMAPFDPESMKTMDDLIRAADDDMYRDKGDRTRSRR